MDWAGITLVTGGIAGLLGLAKLLWPILRNVAIATSHLQKLPALIEDVAVIKRDASQAREQVKNSHTSNFREDIDGKHEEVLEHFKQVNGRIDGLVEENKSQWMAINTNRRRTR